MGNGTEPITNMEREYLMNKILTDAYEENSTLRTIENSKLISTINLALNEINLFERTALHPNFPKTVSEASRIKAIWVFSGPGTYDEPFKEDRYTDKPWAQFMDRRRLNYAAWLMRKLTEVTIGKALNGLRDSQEMRKAIFENGPYLIYNGREDENETVRNVLRRENIAIPPPKVHIIDAGIDRTFDQVRTFNLPPSLNLSEGDRIALVSHAPHLMRVLHMIGKAITRGELVLPKGVILQVFPVATPIQGRQEYAEMEVRGLLYSIFIAGEAEETAYPYLL